MSGLGKKHEDHNPLLRKDPGPPDPSKFTVPWVHLAFCQSQLYMRLGEHYTPDPPAASPMPPLLVHSDSDDTWVPPDRPGLRPPNLPSSPSDAYTFDMAYFSERSVQARMRQQAAARQKVTSSPGPFSSYSTSMTSPGERDSLLTVTSSATADVSSPEYAELRGTAATSVVKRKRVGSDGSAANTATDPETSPLRATAKSTDTRNPGMSTLGSTGKTADTRHPGMSPFRAKDGTVDARHQGTSTQRTTGKTADTGHAGTSTQRTTGRAADTRDPDMSTFRPKDGMADTQNAGGDSTLQGTTASSAGAYDTWVCIVDDCDHSIHILKGGDSIFQPTSEPPSPPVRRPVKSQPHNHNRYFKPPPEVSLAEKGHVTFVQAVLHENQVYYMSLTKPGKGRLKHQCVVAGCHCEVDHYPGSAGGSGVCGISQCGPHNGHDNLCYDRMLFQQPSPRKRLASLPAAGTGPVAQWVKRSPRVR